MAGVQCKFVVKFSNYVWSRGAGQHFENQATFHTQMLRELGKDTRFRNAR
jgi:hypothetical protein